MSNALKPLALTITKITYLFALRKLLRINLIEKYVKSYIGVWGRILRIRALETSPNPSSHARHFLKKAKVFHYVNGFDFV